MKDKKFVVLGIIVGLLLVGFTVYFLLDTFVIERAYTPAPSPSDSVDQTADPTDDNTDPSETTGDSEKKPDAVITDTSYQDDNISIEISTHREYDTDIYVADVKISSPEYLKTAFAKGAFGHNIKDETSDVADSVNAIFAVNGDYYSVREEGYVVRDGILYRDVPSDREALAIYKDGSLGIYKEEDVPLDQIMEDGARDVLCFGPGLIRDGEIDIGSHSKSKHPRTAIGLIDDLHYLFVVTDGRVDDSEGLSLQELAEFMLSFGVKTAYNLDGGGSSSMYFNGKVLNDTVDDNERRVSDIVYIGY